MSAAGRPLLSHEEQLAAIRAGAQLVEVRPVRRADPQGTLGGVASALL